MGPASGAADDPIRAITHRIEGLHHERRRLVLDLGDDAGLPAVQVQIRLDDLDREIDELTWWRSEMLAAGA